MPRSKNPNPRQVTEEEERKAGSEIKSSTSDSVKNSSPLSEDSDILKLDLEGGESPASDESPMLETIAAKRDSLAKLTARKFAAIYNASDESENELVLRESPSSELEVVSNEENASEAYMQDETPETRTSLNFSPSSPPSFFVMGNKTRPLPPLKRMVQANSAVNGHSSPLTKATKSSKGKSSSPSGMLNPEIMKWMRTRFEMRPGGKMSASDIIQVYNYDMKELPNPPPSLQNYQVGQLLRRIFPTIQRCKITVNGKRVWVYRHLTLVETEADESKDVDGEMENGNGLTIDEGISESSPVMGTERPESTESGDNSNGGHEKDTKDGMDAQMVKKEKSNTILLGLLGQRNTFNCESLSPTNDDATEETTPKCSQNFNELSSINGEDSSSGGPMKKKRDSEVVEWLQKNYKFKPGYFVKSMDLLRRYNDGREELVKYLSQVGRVMKHVFPGVRHLRKSFRGGKREWVYLNLKPIDVDSDSEEGLKMQMPSFRRVSYPTDSLQNLKTKTDSHDWKRERVNVTHMPLTPNRNAVFKPHTNVYHSVSQIGGNKLVISRTEKSPNQKEQLEGDTEGNHPQLEETSEKSINRTRIILYNKQRDVDKSLVSSSEDYRAPSDLERDIFAPFTKTSAQNHSTALGEKSIQLSNQSPASGDKDGQIVSSDWTSTSNSGVFQKNSDVLLRSALYLDNEDEKDYHWASKRLKLCATETSSNVEASPLVGSYSEDTGLDLSIKQEYVAPPQEDATSKLEPAIISQGEYLDETEDSSCDQVLNLTKYSKKIENTSTGEQANVTKSPAKLQTIHYKPSSSNKITIPVKVRISSESGHSKLLSSSLESRDLISQQLTNLKSGNSLSNGLSVRYIDGKNAESGQKRKFCVISRKSHDAQISWDTLQNFNAQRYGWLRSPHTTWTTAKAGQTGEKRVLRFVEWFLFSGQWLVDKQRALREIKIYDDWTVVIHALGRRVYPNDLGGITDLEKTAESLNKVFRVLAEAKLCMGFPAPCVSDLYIHGILVSKFEVWSSREDSGEDIRQRAVNCQILYSSPGSCCNKCARIMKLHHQQKRGAALMKRPGSSK